MVFNEGQDRQAPKEANVVDEVESAAASDEAKEQGQNNVQGMENQFEAEVADATVLQAQLAQEKLKAEDYLNRLQRLQADFDNYRRRVQKEKEELVKYASSQLCEALLPVLDNFQFALAAKDERPDQVAQGVALIERQLEEVLSKEGLTPVPAVGEQFDPAHHEAVMVEETAEHPDNTVLEELRRGYVLNDKLIRPAMVKVAKSGS